MLTKTCRFCNKEMKSTDFISEKRFHQHQFCNKDCYFAFRKLSEYETLICPACKKEFKKEKRKHAVYCSETCVYNGRQRKVGHTFLKEGYVMLCLEHGWVAQHRHVMEQFIGRPLHSTELVHHINGNRQDNRIENLQLVTKSEHGKIHVIDGRLWTKESNRKRIRAIFGKEMRFFKGERI